MEVTPFPRKPPSQGLEHYRLKNKGILVHHICLVQNRMYSKFVFLQEECIVMIAVIKKKKIYLILIKHHYVEFEKYFVILHIV